jgi:hypothetical protein
LNQQFFELLHEQEAKALEKEQLINDILMQEEL